MPTRWRWCARRGEWRVRACALRGQLGGPLASDRRRPGKRGPKTELSDDELAGEIRTVLSESPFLGEGHRKVQVRLAAKGIRRGRGRRSDRRTPEAFILSKS